MRTKLREAAIGYAIAFLVACLALMFLGLLANVANAGGVCRQQVVAQQYAVPLLAPVYYKIGAGVEQEAADTLQFRHSEEYIELQQLRGFKAGVDAVTAVSGDRPSSPSGLAMKGGDNPGGAEHPPVPPAIEPSGNEKWDAFRARFPMTSAKCAGCHGRKNPDAPDGDLFLNGDMTLDGQDGALRRFNMLTKVYNGHMPPKKPLTDEEYSAFQAELLIDPTPPEGE